MKTDRDFLSRRDMHALDELLDGPQLPVLLLTPRWSEITLVDPGTEDLCHVGHDEHGLVISIRAFVDRQLVQIHVPAREEFRPGAYQVSEDGSMSVFGLRKLGPGTWLVQPSVNMPETIHAFVVLCEVPEPAPWEKKPRSSSAASGK